MIVFYCVILLLLGMVSLHRLRLALTVSATALKQPTPLSEWPPLLVQLPIYNEGNTASKLIDAVSVFDYPADKLMIQVLDDSTDATSIEIAQQVAHWQQQGCAIVHLQRSQRDGFKAGALAAGMKQSEAPFIAIFDADFIPPKDFPKLLLPHFAQQDVGMVQARWGHINRRHSLLTRAQALLLDGHFSNEHGGRFSGGFFFNFNGTAGIWRRQAIVDGGGWLSRTLTEDLDLSYRSQLAGWRFIYRQDVVVDAELPTGMKAFKAQQHRWAKGSIETARHLLPIFMSSHAKATIGQRREALLHLLANGAYPLVIALTLLLPSMARHLLVTDSGDDPWHGWRLLEVPLATLSMGSLILFYALALHRVGSLKSSFVDIPATLILGAGLAVNNTIALMEAVWGYRTPFVRTPKSGVMDPLSNFKAPNISLSWQNGIQVASEISLGIYLLSAMSTLLHGGHYGGVVLMGILASGFITLGVATLIEEITSAPTLRGKNLTDGARQGNIDSRPL